MGGRQHSLWLASLPFWLGFAHVDGDPAALGDLQPGAEVAATFAPRCYASGPPASLDADGSVTFLGRRPLADAGAPPLDDATLGDVLEDHFVQATGGDTHLARLAVYHDDPRGDRRRVAWVQTHLGVPLLGTYALAKVEGDSLTYARHFVVAAAHLARVSAPPEPLPVLAEEAAAIARADLRRHAARADLAARPERAWYYDRGDFVMVWQVPVTSDVPFGRWSIFVDATVGTVRGRKKLSFDAAAGSVTANIEPTCQGEASQEAGMPHISWGHDLFTDADGKFSSDGGALAAEVTLTGPYVRVIAPAGTQVTWGSDLAAHPAFNEVSLGEAPSAQVNAFYHVHRARSWLRATMADEVHTASPLVRWTDSQLPVRVDLPSGHRGQSCNAFYDGDALNFFVADANVGCNNTARVAKIIYHEYGHGIHDHLTATRATLNKQVSEGVADYVSAAITGDPHMTGLMGCDEILEGRATARRPNLRTCKNAYAFCRSRKCHSHPRDEEHNAAPILCGALWDLREALAERYGAAVGHQKADRFVLKFLGLVTDMSSAYAAAIAADEDDDGNPANGTRHSCEINRAFLGVGAGKRPHFPDALKDQVPCHPTGDAPALPKSHQASY